MTVLEADQAVINLTVWLTIMGLAHLLQGEGQGEMLQVPWADAPLVVAP